MTTEPTAVIVAGIIGSDTAKFLKEFFRGAIFVSVDQIRADLDGSSLRRRTNSLAIWEEFRRQIVQALSKGRNVVIVPAFLRSQGRKALVEFCREAGAGEVDALRLMASRQDWLQAAGSGQVWTEEQPPETLLYMWRDLQKDPPSEREGFANIHQVSM